MRNEEWFTRQLRTVLNSLYDPSVLRDSPLVQLFGVTEQYDAVAALRRILTDAIESLKPNADTPHGSRTWRVYQILRRRYTEQVTQDKVASDLSLSVRQLQREEKLAREMLADQLWTAYHLEARPRPAEEVEQPFLTRTRELEWLRDSAPVQMTDPSQVMREVLETVAPLLTSTGVKVDYAAPDNPSRIPLQELILRQALLNIMSTAIATVPGGEIHLWADILPHLLRIGIRVVAPQNAALFRPEEYAESLELAQALMHLSDGTLEIVPDMGPEVFTIVLTLPPAAEQATVLVIDDNADALQLFQRYLSGSRYHFVGAQDAQRGLALAEELAPQAIILDVMMPTRDGWAVLGQLRVHPKTHDVPVIVCTILPQEQLALTLGAAEFLRKPVSRQTLLAALERQMARSQRESR